ncbi:hypothetical protein PNK_0599 [Candidatus Protochlamydia naegleriophila]|uniref:Uncharacterized protein n=1 Tax=Candidatus Protochlamydia naegleriophila TaxID=389348 RepID=A0A0U5EQ38_9BACT|nr:hypothetical protein [Candidatus Protochlamydia naegleriophila]CUI16227.1 hypothetical protein PNK_0599 [Candidatus Protochlamydia naegleriophila]
MNTIHYSSEITMNSSAGFQTTQQSTLYSVSNHKEECVTHSAQIAFQSLSLDLQQSLQNSLDSNSQKFFKLFLRKKKEDLEQTEDTVQFKNALVDVLSQLELRMNEGDACKEEIHNLQHDLKNQVLINVFKKYYSVPVTKEGTILKELAPYLGNQEKIDLLSQHEGKVLQEKVIGDLQEYAVNRDSLMALMIRSKKEKSSGFNCYTVDACDLQECLENLKRLFSQKGAQQIQLLVRNDVHYTAVIVESNEGVLQAAVMDAAKDKRGVQIALFLKKLNYEKVFIVGDEDRIQFDSYNCSFFSFDSVFQAYKHGAFFNMLNSIPAKNKGELFSVAWKDMPPSFVRNATSTSFVQAYAAKNEAYKQGDTFETYLNRHTAYVDIGRDNPVKVHTVLATRVKKEGEKIKKMVAELPHQELLETVVRFSARNMIRV